MPYIYVDELPEGVEEADVIARSDYDAIVEERNTTIEQRDSALSQIEDSRKEVRDIKAKYADYILSSSSKKPDEQKPEQQNIKSSLPVSVSELF